MVNKSTLIIVLVLLFPLFSFTQKREQLRKIIASSYSIEMRQQKLDSFFMKETKGIPPKVMADCYHDYSVRWCYVVGWKQERNETLLEQGIWYARKAAEIRKHLDSVNYRDLKNSLYNIGLFNHLRGHFFEAISAYKELISIGHIDIKTMDAYRWLGIDYTRIGDFYKALGSYEKVIAFCKKDTTHIKLLVDTYTDRAGTYSYMGYKEFSERIRANLNYADSILKKNKLKDKYRKSQILQIEGNRLLKTGEYQNAIPLFKEVLKFLDKNDSINLATVYNSFGLSQLKLFDFEKGLENSKKAISYDPNAGYPYENLGDYYIQKKEYKKGLWYYQKAITMATAISDAVKFDSTITPEGLELAVKKELLLGHLISKANGWVSYYKHDQNKAHLTQALQTFKLADQLVDLIRFESTEYKSKLFWRGQGALLYMKAVEVCYLLNRPEEAYYFMEKNKALLLLEDITNEEAKENAKLPDIIAKREFDLKRMIFLSENEVQNSVNKPKDTLAALKDRIYEHKQHYELFVDSLAIAFPEYATTKKKIEVLPCTVFKEKYVTDQEIVLQYIVNKDQGYGLLSSLTHSILFAVDKVGELNKDIVLQHEQLSKSFSNQDQVTKHQEVSYRIFQKLVPQNIHDIIKGKNLTIIPDYTLQQLSFETLVTTKDNLRYLIEDTEIRYAYSMSYLDRNQQIKRNPEKGFVSFAPVVFEDTQLSDLALSKDEVTAIQKIFGGEALLHKQASKTNFLDRVHNYSIIHLSTHADIGDAANPWIAFADQKVSLNEIYATKNQSDMVVLSACKTSLGELKKGEGVMSLARGFFYSGTKSVVSSLWSSNDKSNQELMIGFYKNLDEGLTKSAALRKSKRDYIHTHSGSEQSPFYWGSLVLIGDNAVLQLSSSFLSWIWIGLLTVLILITTFFYMKRKKK